MIVASFSRSVGPRADADDAFEIVKWSISLQYTGATIVL